MKQHLETNFFFISPKSDFRVDAILERAKFLVRRKGIKVLVIDPYNRLEDESEGCHIRIRAEKSQAQLAITVENTGSVFEEDLLKKLLAKEITPGDLALAY